MDVHAVLPGAGAGAGPGPAASITRLAEAVHTKPSRVRTTTAFICKLSLDPAEPEALA